MVTVGASALPSLADSHRNPADSVSSHSDYEGLPYMQSLDVDPSAQPEANFFAACDQNSETRRFEFTSVHLRLEDHSNIILQHTGISVYQKYFSLGMDEANCVPGKCWILTAPDLRHLRYGPVWLVNVKYGNGQRGAPVTVNDSRGSVEVGRLGDDLVCNRRNVYSTIKVPVILNKDFRAKTRSVPYRCDYDGSSAFVANQRSFTHPLRDIVSGQNSTAYTYLTDFEFSDAQSTILNPADGPDMTVIRWMGGSLNKCRGEAPWKN